MVEQVDIRQMVRDYHRGVTRRKNAALQQVGDAIAGWMVENLTGPLRPDWRETFRAVLAKQAAQGRKVIPQSAAAWETAIEQYSRLCAWQGRHPRRPTPLQGPGAQVPQSAMPGEPYELVYHCDIQALAASPDANAALNTRPQAPQSGSLQFASVRQSFRKSSKQVPPPRNVAPPAVPPKPTVVDGVEVAGPGPIVADSYKFKVQRALETLDRGVANWWKARSVNGQIRSRDARFWQFGYYSKVEAHDQPFIYVDENFSAGQTAQAIIAEANSGWFITSIGAYYKKYKLARTWEVEEFRQWQRGSAREAAQLASVLAELYVGGIASLNPAGDLVVTINDVVENGFQWQQLISILPYVGHLPIAGIVLKLGGREVHLPKTIVKLLDRLTDADRKALETAVRAAKSDEEAADIIEQVAKTGHVPEHHIATNKNWISTVRGGPWSPAFEKLFRKAGMTLEDAANTAPLPGHFGPHPEQYHQEIFDRLSAATAGKNGSAYRQALLDELRALGREVRTPGSKLNRMLAK